MEYIEAKHMLTPTQDKLWFGTDYTMNIYKGCCHGCIYCDSRSRCYILLIDKCLSRCILICRAAAHHCYGCKYEYNVLFHGLYF